MSLEGDLQALLAPLVAGSCWPVTNTSPNPAYPYIVFNKVSGIPETVLDGYAGMEKTLFQIDVYAKTYGEAKKVSRQIFEEIDKAYPQASNKEMEMDGGYNKDLQDYRVISEYEIWSEDYKKGE